MAHSGHLFSVEESKKHRILITKLTSEKEIYFEVRDAMFSRTNDFKMFQTAEVTFKITQGHWR